MELSEALEVRRELVVAKKEAETALEELDNQIRVEMLQGNIDKFEDDGWKLKLANGTNTRIDKKKLIDALTALEMGPDEVGWVVEEATVNTPYDYIDMRKVKEVKGEE